MKTIEEEALKEVDLKKVLKTAGISKEALNKAKSLKRARDFKRDLSEFREKAKIFKEEFRRYEETGESVKNGENKNKLKKAGLLRITLDGRKIKKRFLQDKLKNLREEEARLGKEAKTLNLKFKKELEDIKIE